MPGGGFRFLVGNTFNIIKCLWLVVGTGTFHIAEDRMKPSDTIILPRTLCSTSSRSFFLFFFFGKNHQLYTVRRMQEVTAATPREKTCCIRYRQSEVERDGLARPNGGSISFVVLVWQHWACFEIS